MNPKKVGHKFLSPSAILSCQMSLERNLPKEIPLCCQTLNPSIQTKPGVIRPMTAIPRLTVEDEEQFHPNPFRQFVVKQTLTDNKKVG